MPSTCMAHHLLELWILVSTLTLEVWWKLFSIWQRKHFGEWTRQKPLRFNLFWKMEAILFARIPMAPNSGHFLLPLLSLELPLLQWQWQKVNQYTCLDLKTFLMKKRTLNLNHFHFCVGKCWGNQLVQAGWKNECPDCSYLLVIGEPHFFLLHPSWLRFYHFLVSSSCSAADT